MECILAIVGFLHYIIYLVARAIHGLIYRSKPAPVARSANPLLELSATALAKQIREGQITSQAVIEAYVERIKEVNLYVNAVVEERFEEAVIDAKQCDEKLKSGEVNPGLLEREKPLYGVPFTVKESCGLKGLSQTGCCIARRGMKAPDHGLAVQMLRDAGGIPLCVTNTPELCASFDSTNFLFGSTNNPYDRRCTAGGSSGGEGALIGAGGSLIGVGSDLAGSVRVPAHFNGIFGHKPTPGIIPIKGHFPMSEEPEFLKLLTIGPMTRYAEDLHLAVKVMSSQFGHDLRLDEPVDLRNLRLFSIDRLDSFLGIRKPTQDIRQSINAATNYLVESGARLHEVPKFWFNDLYNVIIGKFFSVPGQPPLLLNKNDPNKENKAIPEIFKSIIGKSDHKMPTITAKLLIRTRGLIPASRGSQYSAKASDLRQKFTNLLKDDGVLIFPTFPMPTCFKKLVMLRPDCSIYCMFANVMQFPSTHVPMGINKDGLPIGFQVMAGPNQDRLCLAVARELEKKFGGWKPPGST